jgi:hypothetical protein
MGNGMEALSSKLGVSMENQTTTFFRIASNHRADQSTEVKHQAPNHTAFAPYPSIKLQISAFGYICLPLVAKKETYSGKRTWLPHP